MVLSTGSVKTRQPGVRYEVNNVQAATENLLEWPKRGRHWNKAVQACLGAFAGDLSPDDLRIALTFPNTWRVLLANPPGVRKAG
ncbi:MAG: DUF982 domain-containing protein [Mesorhizobium sp.]|uniref:DUF982 domain-containing protein n=1 Tax=Mesorhizobium sp. TaxID=1871066 RepID=UPI0012207E22|nr:MAG: DUF982 domain-containing protein [Mesorhizobium sp.]TIO82983.1 MAG: DUF982 domain-containing protein [Mesorhizobium sp.]